MSDEAHLEVIGSGIVGKARKAHKCDWCGEPIPVGTPYHRTTAKVEGAGPFGFPDHIECHDARARAFASDPDADIEWGHMQRGQTEPKPKPPAPPGLFDENGL